MDFLEKCQETESFRERTAKAWAAFAAGEEELRRIMDEDKKHERGDELIARCSEMLELAFERVSFELGFNGQKHELILTPEGDKVKLFELVYFWRHAPAEVLEKWNILVGRQPSQRMGLRSGDLEIESADVQVWVEKQERGGVGLILFCEKLLPELERDENHVWWMLTTLTDMILGEIAGMACIDWFDVAREPRQEPGCSLSELPETLQDLGLELAWEPEAYLERYTAYHMEPNEDQEADLRLDVIVGSSSCLPLVNGYYNGSYEHMDRLYADGVVAGFICYPLAGFERFEEKERSQRIFELRDDLEAALEQNAGADGVTLIGGATGVYCGYVDFIAWDLLGALDAAREFFAESGLEWASFQVFRRDCPAVPVWNEKENQN